VGLDKELFWSEESTMTTALFICIMCAVFLWVLIWRPVVRWRFRTMMATTGLAIAFTLTAFAPYWPGTVTTLDATVYSSPLWMWGLWMFGTAWLWRTKSVGDPHGDARVDELADAAPRCPSCAYSLRGLSEARCPECGWKGTLDAIIAPSMGLEV